MADQPLPGMSPRELDALEAPHHGRAVAIAAIAAVLVLCFTFMVLRGKLRGTSYDGMCNLVAAPARTC